MDWIIKCIILQNNNNCQLYDLFSEDIIFQLFEIFLTTLRWNTECNIYRNGLGLRSSMFKAEALC